MECLTEFTCSVFVDGELPERELQEVEGHLEKCPDCRGMVTVFREESRLLIHCIQEIDLMESMQAVMPAHVVPPQRSARSMDIVKSGGLLVGLATLIKLAMSSPENFALPSLPISLDWLDPSDLSGRLNWLMGAIAYIAAEGVSGMTSLVNGLSVATMYVLILAGVVVMVRRSVGKNIMTGLVSALGAILLMTAGSSSSYAMDVRNAGNNKVVTISAGQLVDDSLFATGDAVIVDGTVNGDLIAFARQVTVHGTVKGNIFTGAQSIDVQGTVEGSIFAGAQTIQINGPVTRNVTGFSQSVTIGKDAHVGGDASAFAGEVHVNGTVDRSFYGSGLADIAGTVGRNVVFHGGAISVLPSARIAGDLTSYVPKTEMVRVDPGATIGGKQTVELPKPASNKYATFSFYFGQLLHVAAAFITGVILLLLFPGLRRVSFDNAVTVLKSAGVGFLLIVATPIAALILAITLIGFPIAFAGIMVWLLGMYLAKIIIANFIGRTLLASQGDRMSSVMLGLFVGLVLVFVIINLPFVGGLVHSFLVLIGSGALAFSVFGSLQAAHDSGR